jgi:AraC-like DNA-binding protein
MIPTTEKAEIAAAEGTDPLAQVRPRPLLASEDVELTWCMANLASRNLGDGRATGSEDETSRQLILRLVALSGGGTPDWHADGSMFDRRVLEHLIEYVDAHLKITPSLSEIGLRVGLSPSHFAKKFRQSTGLSFHRFVNRRRIVASLESLKDRSKSLAHTALELGFSSQSHMTRLFSDTTGMTPAKFQKQVRPAMGNR